MQPREAWFSIPRWSNLGISYGGLFIQASHVCPQQFNIPIVRPCGAGDGRGFSPYAGRGRYRANMGFDFTIGIAYFRLNPSCVDSGKCFRPHEIEQTRIADFPDRSSKIDRRITNRTVGFSWSLRNSAIYAPNFLTPSIDGGISFSRAGSVSLNLDGYPSFELYHKSSGAGRPTCVYQFGETSFGALALPAFVPGLDEGRSHC